MITYLQGDLIKELPKDEKIIKIIPHVCNNIPIIGSGLALALAKKWPEVKKQNKSTTLGDVEFINVEHSIIVANMVSQHKTNREIKKPIRYVSLVDCMLEVKEYINALKVFGEVQIHTGKFGSLRSGGTWHFIEELIDEIWGDISVYIYEYKEKS